jgi:hypothetical protein
MTTAHGYWNDIGLASDDTGIFDVSATTIWTQLILCVEGSPVNPTAMPGSEEAQKMTAISGRKCGVLLRSYTPLVLLLRMCLESSGLSSTACYLTWEPLATRRLRLGFRLAPWIHPSHARGYSLWPSPNRSEAKRMTYSLRILGEQPEARRERGVGVFFTEAIVEEFGGYPTPEFVEWLMGFPGGWTELPHSEMP